MNKRKNNNSPLKIAVLGHKTIPSRQGGSEIVVEELTVSLQLSLQTKNTKEVFDVKKKNVKLCLVASQGGHIEELLQLQMLREKYDYYLVVPKTAWTEKLAGHKVFIKDMNRKNKITKVRDTTERKKYISMTLDWLRENFPDWKKNVKFKTGVRGIYIQRNSNTRFVPERQIGHKK